MHEAPKSLSDYRKQIDEALQDDFLRRTLDTFAVSYRANREAVFQEVDERGLIARPRPRKPMRSSPASPRKTTSSGWSNPNP